MEADDFADNNKHCLKRIINKLTTPPDDIAYSCLAGNYSIKPEEIRGEVCDWILNYLEQSNCPNQLAIHLAATVAAQISASVSASLLQDDGDSSPVVNASSLQTDVLNCLQEICSQFLNDSSKMESHNLKKILPFSSSIFAIKNKRRKMEDRHVVIHDLNSLLNLVQSPSHAYYAVYDGHGGVDAANYAAAHLHENIAEHPEFLTDTVKAIKEAYKLTDAHICDRALREGLKGGCTVISALIREQTLYLSWCGDSQGILIKRGSATLIAEPHKPGNPEEKKRIEDLGGFVYFVGTWRVNGTLAVARSLGDHDFKPYVSSEPDVNEIHLDGAEDFLVLACDGLWDNMSPEQVTSVLYKNILDDSSEASVNALAEKLVHTSKLQGSEDNISVIVVLLRNISDICADAASYNVSTIYMNGKSEISELNHTAERPKDLQDLASFPSLDADFNQSNSHGLATNLPPEATALSELPTPPIDDIAYAKDFSELDYKEQMQQLQSHLERSGFQGTGFGAALQSEERLEDSGYDPQDLYATEVNSSTVFPVNVLSVRDATPEKAAMDMASHIITSTIETAVEQVNSVQNNIGLTSPSKLNPNAQPFIPQSPISPTFDQSSSEPNSPKDEIDNVISTNPFSTTSEAIDESKSCLLAESLPTLPIETVETLPDSVEKSNQAEECNIDGMSPQSMEHVPENMINSFIEEPLELLTDNMIETSSDTILEKLPNPSGIEESNIKPLQDFEMDYLKKILAPQIIPVDQGKEEVKNTSEQLNSKDNIISQSEMAEQMSNSMVCSYIEETIQDTKELAENVNENLIDVNIIPEKESELNIENFEEKPPDEAESTSEQDFIKKDTSLEVNTDVLSSSQHNDNTSDETSHRISFVSESESSVAEKFSSGDQEHPNAASPSMSKQVIGQDSLLPKEVQDELIKISENPPSETITDDSHSGAVAVDLQKVPEGVPEADGVSEDIDSDSEKDGGWSFVKPTENVEVTREDATIKKKPIDKKSTSTKLKKEPVKQIKDAAGKTKVLNLAEKPKKLPLDKKTELKATVKTSTMKAAPINRTTYPPPNSCAKPNVKAANGVSSNKVTNGANLATKTTSSVQKLTTSRPVAKATPFVTKTVAKTTLPTKPLQPKTATSSTLTKTTTRPVTATTTATQVKATSITKTNTASTQPKTETQKTTLLKRPLKPAATTASKTAPSVIKKPPTTTTTLKKVEVKDEKNTVNKQITAKKVLNATQPPVRKPTPQFTSTPRPAATKPLTKSLATNPLKNTISRNHIPSKQHVGLKAPKLGPKLDKPKQTNGVKTEPKCEVEETKEKFTQEIDNVKEIELTNVDSPQKIDCAGTDQNEIVKPVEDANILV